MITVVGDAFLDVYLHGEVVKPNPEGPGVVIRITDRQIRPGGAASVAAMIAALGKEVHLVAPMADDAEGHELFAEIRRHNVIIDKARALLRHTNVKQRIVAGGTLLHNRIDFEHLQQIAHKPLMDQVRGWRTHSPKDLIVVQDYGKGAVSYELMESLGEYALNESMRILVDPAYGWSWSKYAMRATELIKANYHEALHEATNQGIDGDNPIELTRSLNNRFECGIIVTNGADGLYIAPSGMAERFAAPPVEVRDTCGAGDSVMAALAVALSDGKTRREACQFAVEVAAEQVRHLGAAAEIYRTWK